ncbi:hypothetical protein DSCO28_24370 [Desulfosarcina ovata subsp. sediminis]|uniref:Uncharacterized protein n=1 Tax=Desulfosarcina ovata subsp. sediminis TaxID=885957 RepID=A0A5K7ZLN5_9BACT|nr:CsgG/HfaB family protein [Desulfosarcina ovata]BBO81871.1 hypothetical protein DSCO28_24370 [Desulfosarcina ovata subsp. sediminis]
MIALFLNPTDLEAAPSSTAMQSDAGNDVDQRIAIYPFVTDNAEKLPHSDFLPEWISQSLAEYLSEAKTIQILERRKLDALLSELRLGTSDLVHEDTRLRLGRLLGVDYFVFGSYVPVGDQLLISAHLVSTASGVVVKAADSQGAFLQVKPIVQRLSAKLLDGLGHRVQAETLRQAGSMPGPEIRTLYDKGLEQEHRGQTEAALDYYRQILAIEPDQPWAREAVQRLAATGETDGTGYRHCPGGRRRSFIVSAIENEVDDAAWKNRLIAVGLINLIHEELFATGCYLPVDTDDETRQLIQDLVIDRWSGEKRSTSPAMQPPSVAPRADTQVRLVVKSFGKSRSKLMLGLFSKGKVTVTVGVELSVRQNDGTTISAEGSGKGVTRSKSVGFTIRDDKVHFDESSVGIAVHEAIKAAVGNLMEQS